MICRLLTSDEVFATAHRRWHETYDTRPSDARFSDGRTIEEVCALVDKAPTAEAFAKAVGNKSWTHPSCDMCGQTPRVVVQIKHEWSDKQQDFCKACLSQALKLFSVISDADATP